MSHERSGAVAHVAAAFAIAALMVAVWRPAAPVSPSGAEQDAAIARLAMDLAEIDPRDAGSVAQRLEALTRVPPSAAATQALATSLIECRVAELAEPEHTLLARGLYAVMRGGDYTAGQLAGMVDDIQRAATIARCGSEETLALMHAAHDAARLERNVRRDWW